MPDISMCTQSLCPKARECYRFMATPSRWQSYAAFKFGVYGCDNFWPLQANRENSNG